LAEGTIRSPMLADVPHAFLDAAQSDARRFDLVAHVAGPVLAKQVHSALALAVEAPFVGDPPQVDALATATPGLALGIVTADCAPVLLADSRAGVIGAAHAGWRGAQGGVIAATVAAMVRLGAAPERISAAIGPCVAQASYEVDAPLRAHFSVVVSAFFRSGPCGALAIRSRSLCRRRTGELRRYSDRSAWAGYLRRCGALPFLSPRDPPWRTIAGKANFADRAAACFEAELSHENALFSPSDAIGPIGGLAGALCSSISRAKSPPGACIDARQTGFILASFSGTCPLLESLNKAG